MLQVIDNALPADLYARLLAESAALPWSYGSKSNSRTDEHGHWSHKPLHDKRENLADLFSMLKPGNLADAWHQVYQHLKPSAPPFGMRLVRCYYNGYTYGTDGYFHVDSKRGGELTAILYLVPEWQQDWAGETVWRSNDICEGGIKAVLPAPNRLLILPSNIAHCARAVSRKCPALRAVLVFKARPGRPHGFENLSAWLARAGALTLPHQEGSLHDHLMRCYQLCADKNLPDHVRIAAGLHSIYGTRAYPHRLFDTSHKVRADLARLWGEAVENLAYLFSILDRPRCLAEPISLVPSARLKTSHTGYIDISERELEALRWIECANLADQGQLQKWPLLRGLWDGRP